MKNFEKMYLTNRVPALEVMSVLDEPMNRIRGRWKISDIQNWILLDSNIRIRPNQTVRT